MSRTNTYYSHKRQLKFYCLFLATAYMCETAFSTLASMKTKYRSRLTVDSDLRVCLPEIVAIIDKLCSKNRIKPSRPLMSVLCNKNYLVPFMIRFVLSFALVGRTKPMRHGIGVRGKTNSQRGFCCLRSLGNPGVFFLWETLVVFTGCIECVAWY